MLQSSGERVRMVPDKIWMAQGGEVLANVMRRGEDEEFTAFQNSAFKVDAGDGVGPVEGKTLVDREFLD
ncbi:hypothetical protein AHAS_Ahas03G0148200 [Arachis hypogaea]